MSPPKTVSPVIASLRVSSTSVVRGCPGVPRSIPRIETVIELRPVNGVPFLLRSVGIELRTTQKIVVLSTLGSNDTIREYKIYENPFIFRPAVGEFSERLLGIDIPVLIPIPKDIISSGQYQQWNAVTTHSLVVKVSCGDTYNNETNYSEAFPIPIKLYDTLPIYRQFNEPIAEVRNSNCKQVLVELSLPVSSIGPKDDIILFVKTMTDPLCNKISKNLRLKFISFQIKEILECHEGGLPLMKEHKIYAETKSFLNEDSVLNTQGVSHQFRLEFPFDNEYLQMYCNKNYIDNNLSDSKHVVSTYANDKKNRKVVEGIPLTHTQGFTTLGRLFSIRYEAIIKVKLVHGKDMEIILPITISPFNRESSEYLLSWIINQCEVARNKFGKDLVNRLVNARYDETDTILQRFNPPPIVYKYTKSNWVRLGFNKEAFGSNRLGKNLVQYID